MLHTETVEARTLDLIKRLMADAELQDFSWWAARLYRC